MKTALYVTVIVYLIGMITLCISAHDELMTRSKPMTEEESKTTWFTLIIFYAMLAIGWFEYWFIISYATHGLWYTWLA